MNTTPETTGVDCLGIIAVAKQLELIRRQIDKVYHQPGTQINCLIRARLSKQAGELLDELKAYLTSADNITVESITLHPESDPETTKTIKLVYYQGEEIGDQSIQKTQ